MKSDLAFLSVLFLCSAVNSGEFEIDGKTFRLPDGLEISKVAGPGLVDRPICADFDPFGRLYIADSSGSNENVKVQLKKRPHRIVCLEDTDSDGVFDHSRVFADRMMFPEGILWHDHALYVAAPPSIWKLTDTDNDGEADHREEWFQGKTLTGCANDLHGPYLGRDGWIYWCKGAFAEQTYARPGQPPLVTRAAHIFRRHPNGSPIEHVMTGGMDNPVEVVFTPGGERLFTTTFLQHPSGGKRDGVIHAIYGGVYGKNHGVIDGHSRTGDLMPIMTHLGAAAPCGLLQLESSGLGPGFQHGVLACCFNMQKIVRLDLTKHGATFASAEYEFLSCDDLDFHPTDMIEDVDGSVLVLDTGGWYKLCCPTSQLQKSDVLGAVYRIRRTGPPAKVKWTTPNVTQLSSDEVVRKLPKTPRSIRKHLIHHLRKRKVDSIAALERGLQNTDAAIRLHSVWTLCGIDHPSARDAIRNAIRDSDEEVRQAAIHAVALWRDDLAIKSLIHCLGIESQHNRRAAAEALGRIGQDMAVGHLLDSLHSADRVLEHSIIYALIEINSSKQTRQHLASKNATRRRAALIALDQMTNGNLVFEDIQSDLVAEGTLGRSVRWIISRHPQWAGDLVAHVETALQHDSAGNTISLFAELLTQFANQDGVQLFIARKLADQDIPVSQKKQLLQCVSKSQLKQMPKSWDDAIAQLLNVPHPELLEDCVHAISQNRYPRKTSAAWEGALKSVAKDTTQSDVTRLKAFSSLSPQSHVLENEFFQWLLSKLTSQDVQVVSLTIDGLVRIGMNELQWLAVAQQVEFVRPLELAHVLDIFAKTKDARVGNQLIEAIAKNKSARAIPVGILKMKMAHFDDGVKTSLRQLALSLDKSLAGREAQLKQLLSDLDAGDIRSGQRVFHSKKAACITCHEMGYLGGDIGPDLSKIGRIRSQRDLLEAIVFPNITFVRSYEPQTIVTVDGQVLNGIVQSESSDEIIIVTSNRKTIQIATEDIEDRFPSKTSVMPSGLDQQLTKQELADLLAFLQAAK